MGQVPDEHKTPELCMEFVKLCGYNLKYVPEEMKTREMCLEAYRNAPAPDSFPEIVATIPDKNLVFQCLVDSLDRPGAASFASAMRPEQFDDRIADYLVDIDGNSLQYMPERMHTEERLFRAVLSSGNLALSSRNIREELKTDELYMAGIRANSNSFFLFPGNAGLRRCVWLRRTGILIFFAEAGRSAGFGQERRQYIHVCQTAEGNDREKVQCGQYKAALSGTVQKGGTEAGKADFP